MDPIEDIFHRLGSELDPADVARAWRESGSPVRMVRLLAAAGSTECDAAARAAIEAAADALGRTARDAIETLRELARRPTVCGELAHALYVIWISALRDPERRHELEAAIAERVRAVVKRPPTAADLAPPPRRPQVQLDASHLARAIDDPRRLAALDVQVPPGSRVISPESFGRTGPELGGLACERVFGPWWPRSSIFEDDRAERWGYIELARPCAHPIVPGARLAVLPVVPPHFRRWTIVGVDELKRHARERRADLETRDDLCDPPDKILAEEGLADPDAIAEPGRSEHRLDTVYRALINIERRVRRLAELGAPPAVIEQSTEELDGWSRRLVGVWRTWLAELPRDTDAAWALRALAATARP